MFSDVPCVLYTFLTCNACLKNRMGGCATRLAFLQEPVKCANCDHGAVSAALPRARMRRSVALHKGNGVVFRCCAGKFVQASGNSVAL